MATTAAPSVWRWQVLQVQTPVRLCRRSVCVQFNALMLLRPQRHQHLKPSWRTWTSALESYHNLLWSWKANPFLTSCGSRFVLNKFDFFFISVCKVILNQNLFSFFSKNDVLLSEGSHFTFVYDDNECSLVILNAQPEDSGVYTCTARNLAGSVSCKAELTVHEGNWS